MVGMGVFAAFSTMFAMQSYPPVIPYAMREFSLSYSEASLLVTLPSVVGIFLAFPAGMLIVKWGLKTVGALGLILCTIGGFGTFVGPSFLWLEIGRIIMGVGYALVTVVAFTTIPVWFTKNDVGKATGLKSMDMPLATTLALNLLSRSPSILGWRTSFLIPSIILAFATATFVLLYKESPMVKPHKIPFKSIRNRQLWLLGMVWGFFNMGIISYVTWSGTFFIQMKGISSDLSFFMVSLAMLLQIPLSPMVGRLSDRFGRKTFVMTSSLVTAVALLFLPYLMLPLLVLPVVALSVAVTFLPSPTFSMQSKVLPREIAGLGFGVFSTLSALGISVGPYLVGLTRDTFADSPIVFFTMSAFFFLTFLCATFIKAR